MERNRGLARLTLIVSVALFAACDAGATSRTDAGALQACVDRWNWMHYWGHFATHAVPAKVQSSPCRIEIAYRLDRTDSAYAEYLGTYFPCAVNPFGAFECPEHAFGRPGDPPRRGLNARFSPRTGRISLDHPPATHVATPKPDWIRRYPVEAGFIVPFDRHGRLRPGLTLRGRPSSGTTCTTFANIRERSTLYSCGAGLYCFAKSLPHRNGQELACPTAHGSRVFRRGRLRVPTDP